jgi:hypothetical protein
MDAGSILGKRKNRLHGSSESADTFDQGKLQFFENNHEENRGQNDDREGQENLAGNAVVFTG